MKRSRVIVALFLPFLIPSITFACSCLFAEPAFEFNRAKLVFVGRMIGGTEKLSVKDQNGQVRALEAGNVRFTMDEVFKGTAAAEITIEIQSMEGTSCGPYGLKRGEQYVVYAYSNEEDKDTFYSGVCTRTAPTSDEAVKKDDLAFLRNLPPLNTGGTLKGRVWADLRTQGANPLSDVKIDIRNADNQTVTVYTDKDGRFEVKQLKPGKYTVQPEFPPNYTSERKSAEVEVSDRGTAGVGFEAYIDGRVSGKVFDKEGNGFNYIALNLVGGGKTVYGHATGEDGEFVVEGAPPGEYLMHIEMQHRDNKKNRKYYYPGTFDPQKAQSIRVGLGEKVSGLEFRLPDEFRVRTIEGVVTWADGKPAAKVEVALLCPQSSKADGVAVEFMPPSAITDEEGRFHLEGLTGETYWIEARGRKETDKKDELIERHSPARKLTLSESLKSVKLVLSRDGYFGGCEK
jgi:hypothetical protein